MFRLDGQEHEQRKLEKEVEVLFDGNLNRNDSEIFSGFFFINGNYEPPAGFKWGVFIPFEDAVVENPESDEYNIPDVSSIQGTGDAKNTSNEEKSKRVVGPVNETVFWSHYIVIYIFF